MQEPQSSPSTSIALTGMMVACSHGRRVSASGRVVARADHDDFKVQLNAANSTRPIGYCDGTDADMAELRELASTEGADEMRFQRKLLTTGREVWTLG
jgi:hypothetical protein